MSMTLNLIDRLLSMGRNYQTLQRHREALKVLGRLASFRRLPAETAEEVQVRLAEILLRHRKHRRARRHLTAALLYQPDNARYHYLMAKALDTRTDDLDADRALEHYRKSLELDEKQPRCWSDYGSLCLHLGQIETGLAALRQSVERSPDDPLLLGRLMKALYREKQSDEAQRRLLAARFRNADDSRFTKLYNDFMFRQLRKKQTAARRKAALLPDYSRNVILPFVRSAEPTSPAIGNGRLLRLDSPAPLAGTHSPQRPVRRTDWKHG